MSWQLAAFAVLAVGLTLGFAWYERVRPDARIIALVGTLAAFAALGRIAFAAVPNVKPTTDIVLISGYALGGGPGFAIGALAGLSSNFFFGQGPWTPWQMAAWGATGIFGAGLAWMVAASSAMWGRGGPRRPRGAREPAPIGRWPLALACCLAGFAFTVVQDVGDWVTFSDHSSGQLGVYVGQGLGFDAVHAGGCVLFALALGPALARSIARFSRRLQVTWVPPRPPAGAAAPLIAGALVLGAILAPRVSPAQAAAGPSAVTASASAPASYLLRAENSDGGFGAAPGQPSAALYAGWAALGLASAGYDLGGVGHGGSGLIAYLRTNAAPPADVGSLERTILVVRAAGLSARSFAGHDLVTELQRRFRRDGSISEQVNLTSFAILALRSAGEQPGPRTRAWLVSQQDHDGGFGFAGAGGSSDSDDTGAVLEALAGEPGAAATRARAVAFLRRQQDGDGGFPSQPGGGSNAQSTAWAVQGLIAAGVPPATVRRHGSGSPLTYLDSLIAPSGAIRYARGVDQTPVWVTGEALMAINGKPLPLAAPATAAPRPPAGPPAAPRTAVSHPHAHPRTTVSHRAVTRRPRRQTPIATVATGPSTSRLAGAIGVVTALVLAPVGLG
jgi:energy-coupling factor transport system substrate-specific component